MSLDDSQLHVGMERASMVGSRTTRRNTPSFDRLGFFRPFVIPVFDPQHSNQDCPKPNRQRNSSANSRAGLERVSHDSTTSDSQIHSRWYDGKPLPSIPGSPKFSNDRRSRLSVTPFEFPIMSLQEIDFDNSSEHIANHSHDLRNGPPNGGITAWLHVFAGFLVIFNAQGLNMTYGVFQAYYEKVTLRSTPPYKIAWIGSTQIFFLFFMALIVSPAVEKGSFRMCFSGGSVLLLLSIFMTSYCSRWHEFLLVQGIVTGIAMGTVFSSGLTVLLGYFSSRLGMATGLAAAGAPMGGILFPLIARAAIGRIGFAWTLRLFAMVNFVTMTAANIIVRPRPQWPMRKSSLQKRPDQPQRMLEVLPFLLMAAGMFFTFWGLFITYYFIILYGQNILHLDGPAAVNLLIAMSSANFAGRFLPNFISDACLGPLNTIIPWTFVSSIAAFSWIGATSIGSLYLISCFYGFTSAAIQSLYTSTIIGFTGREGKAAAKHVGLVLAIIGLAVLTGAPIGGALIAKDEGGYLSIQLFAGSTLALGGLFFVAARVMHRGWKPAKI